MRVKFTTSPMFEAGAEVIKPGDFMLVSGYLEPTMTLYFFSSTVYPFIIPFVLNILHIET